MNQRKYESINKNVIVLYDEMFPLYIVKGEKNFLIDCSITAKAIDIHKTINMILKRGKIDSVLLTHSHYDHTGACFYLQNIYDFNIYGSYKTVELLKKEKVIDFIDRMNQDFKKLLNDNSKTKCEMLKNLNTIKQGDRIKVDNNNHFEILDTPGHTKCSISFLLQPEKILFPGDSVGIIERNGKIKPLFLSSYKEYEKSLNKLIKIEPHILAFCHNRYIKGKEKVKKFLELSLNSTKELKDKILKMLKKDQDFDKIAKEIFENEFSIPTVMGPYKAIMINLAAMVNSVYREFVEEKI